MCDPECKGKDDEEVYDERSGDSDHRHNLMYDPTALRGEEDSDGIEKAYQRPRRDPFQEYTLVPVSLYGVLQREASNDGSAKRDSEKSCDARSDC